MKRRPRAWRITMWTSLAATVLLAGAAIGSRGEYWYRRVGGAMFFGLEDGGICGGNFGGWIPVPTTFDRSLWSYTPHAMEQWTIWLSAWLPAGATLAVSALSAFMVYRSRRLPGHCPCGYDRSGLPSGGPCPECGRAGA